MGIKLNKLQARMEKLAAKSKFDLNVELSMLAEGHEELHASLRADPDDIEAVAIHREIHEFLQELKDRD